MKYLLLAILISAIVLFIIRSCNSNVENFGNVNIAEAKSLNEWGQNAMSYLCSMDTDSLSDKYSFVKFCDRMIRIKDYNKFLILVVDKPSDFKEKTLNSNQFYYAPTPAKDWYINKNKKAVGETLAFYKMGVDSCEKLAKQMDDALAINVTKSGCEIKNKLKLIKSKGTTAYTRSSSIQYTIGFWLRIDTILPFDRNILHVIKSRNNFKEKMPKIDINKNVTSIKLTISTTDHLDESIEIPSGYIPYKKWIHVTFTLNNKDLKAFVNSRLVSSEKLTGDPIKPEAESLMLIKKKIKKSVEGITIGKLRVIPVAVPKLFIKKILIEEDPTDAEKYKKCLKRYVSMGREIAHSKCSSDLFKGVDNQQSELNVNGRNLQLLNENQFTTSWINKYYRRPSFRIHQGIVYLSGTVDNVFGKGKILILPKEARPDKILFFNSGSQGVHVRLDILPNGLIEVGYWSKPKGIIHLDNIKYPLNTGSPLLFQIPLLVYFVKISKPGKGRMNITEVQVFDDTGKNISKGKRVIASSSKSGYNSSKIVDGKVESVKAKKQMWVSQLQKDNYILIDLQGGHRISKIKIINRTDENQGSVAGAKIALLNMFKKEVSYQFWDKSDYKSADKLNKTLKGLKCRNWYVKSEYAPPTSISGKYTDKNINSYQLTDKEGNVLKSKDKSTKGKDFNFSCKPGYIKSYEHTSNMSSIRNIQCSNGKMDNKSYGMSSKETKTNQGKKCLPWKTARGGKKSYFAKSDDDNACGDPDGEGFDWCYTSNGSSNYWGKCNKKTLDYKKWKYKDYSNKGIGDHNYCRQTPKHSTWGSKKKGSKLWCYTNDKNTPWGYCGRYGKAARNAKEKFYKPEKTFKFEMTETVPTGFKGLTWGNWKGTGVRTACYKKVGNIVYLSGFLKYTNGGSIPANTFIDQLPSNCKPTTLKVFNANTNNGVARIHITEQGKIQFITGDSNSWGIKKGWLCLDGINYAINDKIELKLNEDYESQAASSSGSLEKNKVLEIIKYNGDEPVLNKKLTALTGNMSVCFNVKADENGRQVIFDRGYGGEGAMSLEAGGILNFFYGKHGGKSGGYQTFNGPKISFNEWNHIGFVRDIKNNKLKFFVDGKLVKKGSPNHKIAGRTPGPIKIGHGWINKFSGSITNMMFYKRALSNLEIKKLHASSKGIKLNYGGPKATDHGNGLITLSGIIGFKSGKVVEEICTIHEDIRPNKSLNFFTNQDDKQAMITITPEGIIKVSGASTTSGLISFDGITYFTNKSEQFKYT